MIKDLLKKREPYRNKKLLQASKNRPCAMCGTKDGTEVRAHYTGCRQQSFGKGTSQKCDDYCSCTLCHKCHTKMDNYDLFDDGLAQSERFMFLILKELKRDIEEGLL